MKKYSFIVNPAAGRFRLEQILEQIKSACRLKNILFEIYTTHSPGHAGILAEKIINEEGSTHIISVGGDGTLNEIINGLPHSPKQNDIVVGIIPTGSGNDFIKNLNYPNKIKDVIDFILSDNYKIKSTRAGIVEYKELNSNISTKRFINAAGIGFDAYVAYLKQRNKLFSGIVSYIAAVLKALKDLQFLKCTINIDDNLIEKEVVLLTAGNGVCSGGGFYLTPGGNPFKPKLDFTLIDRCRKSYILRNLPKALINKLQEVPEAYFFEFEALSVKLEQPYYLHADGEIISTTVTELNIKADVNYIKFITGD